MSNPFAQPSQKVGIFIDTQNIYHSAKKFHRGNIDFGNLVKIVTGEREIVRAIAYVIKSDSNQKEISFFEALLHKGIELRIKDLTIFHTGEKKADWDVGIAVDAIRTMHHFNATVLVSGDGDFIPLVEYLKNQGQQVEVAGFGQNTSAKLKEVADFYYDLDEYADQIIIQK